MASARSELNSPMLSGQWGTRELPSFEAGGADAEGLGWKGNPLHGKDARPLQGGRPVKKVLGDADDGPLRRPLEEASPRPVVERGHCGAAPDLEVHHPI